MASSTEAQQLFRQGRFIEAERAFQRVLEHSPNDVEALNVVALGALRSGDPARALELLERAIVVSPDDAVSRHHLGRVHEASGNTAGAVAAFEAAVRLRPEFFIARLSLANALQRAGDAQRALIQYSRTLSDAHQQGRWLTAASIPQALRPAVERASRISHDGQRALYSSLLEPLVQRYGRDSLTRVEKCLRIFLAEEQPAYPDARQKPSFLFFPDLPASAYLDLANFPWIPEFEARTDAICKELLNLLPSEQRSERVFVTEEIEKHYVKNAIAAPKWNGFYFYRYGERRDENCASCPLTIQALDALPLARVPKHAPEVLFSVFTPGTHLLPHRGVTNTRVVGHLPLIVPPDCALRVGGELHEWQEGRVVVFDDTYEHEAWNRSDSTRVVLIFDLWHPDLSEAERAAVAELVTAIGDFQESVEQA